MLIIFSFFVLVYDLHGSFFLVLYIEIAEELHSSHSLA